MSNGKEKEESFSPSHGFAEPAGTDDNEPAGDRYVDDTSGKGEGMILSQNNLTTTTTKTNHCSTVLLSVVQSKNNRVQYFRDYSKKSEVKSRRNQRQKKLLRELKEALIGYKGGKCLDCGIFFDGTNQCIFDFHHPDPKEKEGKIHYRSLSVAKQEADKTVLLCSNCHRITHFKEAL